MTFLPISQLILAASGGDFQLPDALKFILRGKLGQSGRDVLELHSRRGLVTLDSYRPRDAIAVRAGDAWESANVAQLVPAAEIH